MTITRTFRWRRASFPGTLRAAVVAIYAFARGADDIADEGDAPPQGVSNGSTSFARELDRIERGETPADATLRCTSRCRCAATGLPLAPFRDLLSAFRQDVTEAALRELRGAARLLPRSANPVGRLLLHLYGDRATPQAARYADAICTGLQLTNFWQDIAIDWRKGRIYLPADDMHRFGVSGSADRRGPLRRALDAASCASRSSARAGLLESGAPLARVLPLRLGLELKLVVAGGLRILRRDRRGRWRRVPPAVRVLGARDWLAMLARRVLGRR